MPFNLAHFESFAMKAEQLDQAAPHLSGGIEIDKVSEALGFSREEGRALAAQMAEEGWVKVDFGKKPPQLTMLVKGYKAAKSLRQPRWWRWVNNNPAAVAAVVAAFVTGSFLLLSKVVEWLLR